ncbi:unnamed protein product, partial [Urochloa humidicola]
DPPPFTSFSLAQIRPQPFALCTQIDIHPFSPHRPPPHSSDRRTSLPPCSLRLSAAHHDLLSWGSAAAVAVRAGHPDLYPPAPAWPGAAAVALECLAVEGDGGVEGWRLVLRAPPAYDDRVN